MLRVVYLRRLERMECEVIKQMISHSVCTSPKKKKRPMSALFIRKGEEELRKQFINVVQVSYIESLRLLKLRLFLKFSRQQKFAVLIPLKTCLRCKILYHLSCLNRELSKKRKSKVLRLYVCMLCAFLKPEDVCKGWVEVQVLDNQMLSTFFYGIFYGYVATS